MHNPHLTSVISDGVWTPRTRLYSEPLETHEITVVLCACDHERTDDRFGASNLATQEMRPIQPVTTDCTETATTPIATALDKCALHATF